MKNLNKIIALSSLIAATGFAYSAETAHVDCDTATTLSQPVFDRAAKAHNFGDSTAAYYYKTVFWDMASMVENCPSLIKLGNSLVQYKLAKDAPLPDIFTKSNFHGSILGSIPSQCQAGGGATCRFTIENGLGKTDSSTLRSIEIIPKPAQ